MTKKTKLTEDQKVQIRETLKPILARGESQVVFEKVDGTIRSLRCTRDSIVSVNGVKVEHLLKLVQVKG